MARSPRWRPPLVLLLDAALTANALVGATLVRSEGARPRGWRRPLRRALPVLLQARLASLAALRLHRWSFHGCSLNEGGRLVLAHALGSLAFLAGGGAGARGRAALPRSVVLLEFFLTTAQTGAYRFGPRMLGLWRLERGRSCGPPTLVLGAGNAGERLLNDLLRNTHCDLHVVGLVDDDPRTHGTMLHGKPVLGPLEALPGLLAEHGVRQLLIAIPHLPAERLRAVLALCRGRNVAFKLMPASFIDLEQRISAAMLQDLSPEHLLPRAAVAFDPEEVRAQVAGRRVLVTGAAGSIGSEIARQVASHGPASLVLVDINENELYFLERHLRERHPGLALSAVVADIRDGERLLRLGREHAPQAVFHAAAHKHVPLMETAPEEAIKNNVFGTLNVAEMADACGAERFVLISTDKAVQPSSVMGASKRLAELVVRHVAAGSRTRFTAVRFGNVLGSAGSVVPLFKAQIQRGGPVTVTHPDCTRYFMTIPEAVGLVLLAGLGDFGELCLLDMGAPVRIAELAELMITMSGRVPGKDIRIEYTGLRPGEKLAECLLSEEEERTQQVHRRVKVAHSPPPPADFPLRLGALWRAAHTGNVHAVKRALHALVPTYAPPDLPLHLVELPPPPFEGAATAAAAIPATPQPAGEAHPVWRRPPPQPLALEPHSGVTVH